MSQNLGDPQINGSSSFGPCSVLNLNSDLSLVFSNCNAAPPGLSSQPRVLSPPGWTPGRQRPASGLMVPSVLSVFSVLLLLFLAFLLWAVASSWLKFKVISLYPHSSQLAIGSSF